MKTKFQVVRLLGYPLQPSLYETGPKFVASPNKLLNGGISNNLQRVPLIETFNFQLVPAIILERDKFCKLSQVIKFDSIFMF